MKQRQVRNHDGWHLWIGAFALLLGLMLFVVARSAQNFTLLAYITSAITLAVSANHFRNYLKN